jgi:hypothetical protein
MRNIRVVAHMRKGKKVKAHKRGLKTKSRKAVSDLLNRKKWLETADTDSGDMSGGATAGDTNFPEQISPNINDLSGSGVE